MIAVEDVSRAEVFDPGPQAPLYYAQIALPPKQSSKAEEAHLIACVF